MARRAVRRYAGLSTTGWNYARAKFRIDPVYEEVLSGGLLPTSGGTLVDIGCGQGLMLALLIEAETPRFDHLVGVEMRPNVARLAKAALGDNAEIVQADARTLSLERCTAVLLFDVLQMMSAEEQQSLITAIDTVLAPEGVILIREADASSWGFACVSVVNHMKALCVGNPGQRFHFRSRDQWLDFFRTLGLEAELHRSSGRHPLGNVLFRVRKSRV